MDTVKRFGDRCFYGVASAGVYVDIDPVDSMRQVGTEFTVLTPPHEFAFDAAFKHWRVERWHVVPDGVVKVSTTPMTDAQIAWVKRHWPELWKEQESE